MKKIFSTLLLAATVTASPSMAQELRSSYFMQTSDTRHEMNPALLDHAYLTMPLVLGYVNVGTTGNFGLSTFLYKMEPSWQGYGVDGRNLTTFMHPAVDAKDFLGGLKENNRFGVNLKWQLFGMGFKGFGGMNSIELNLRSNTSLALPKSLFSFMKEAGSATDYDISDLGVRSENYMELGLGHSHRINDKLTIGAKLKFLLGLAYTNLEVEKLNIHLNDDYWSIDGNAQFSAAIFKTELAYKDDPSKNYHLPDGTDTGRRRVDDIGDFKFGLAGFGLGIDLGAVYQVTPDLQLSAAVTDLGLMSWNNVEKASSAGTWTFDGFDNPIYIGGTDTGENKIDDQLDAIGDDLEDLFSLYEEEGGKSKETRTLSASVNVGAEYTIPAYRKLRIGFLYTSRLAGIHSWHEGMLSANVRPASWFEATVNGAVSSTGLTGGVTLDFHARHFNFFIGSDRLFGKLSAQGIPLNNGNANVAMGISFPL